MNADMPRINGGIGFAISSPNIKVAACASDKLYIRDNRAAGMDDSAMMRLIGALQKASELHKLESLVSLHISGDADAHYGFGTGTSVTLASLEALFLLNNFQITRDELIQLSGRGGTSGIGLHTYFDGGLVIDLGHKNYGQVPQPSSQAENNFKSPMLLARSDFPDWGVGMCIPSHIVPLSTEAEKMFFESTCPISEAEVYRTTYIALMSIFSATSEGDQEAFIEGVKAMQGCEWKQAEWSCHGQPLRDIERMLYDYGVLAVGMSSLGPSLFFVTNNIDEVIDSLRQAMLQCHFVQVLPSNHGREIMWSN